MSAIQTGRKKEARKASHMRCLREYVVDIAECESECESESECECECECWL